MKGTRPQRSRSCAVRVCVMAIVAACMCAGCRDKPSAPVVVADVRDEAQPDEAAILSFQTVDALLASPGSAGEARVFGAVGDEVMTRTEGDTKHWRFTLLGTGGGQLSVDYRGAGPEGFGPGAEVIVVGTVDAQRARIDATGIMSKAY